MHRTEALAIGSRPATQGIACGVRRAARATHSTSGVECLDGEVQTCEAGDDNAIAIVIIIVSCHRAVLGRSPARMAMPEKS